MIMIGWASLPALPASRGKVDRGGESGVGAWKPMAGCLSFLCSISNRNGRGDSYS